MFRRGVLDVAVVRCMAIVMLAFGRLLFAVAADARFVFGSDRAIRFPIDAAGGASASA